MAGRPARKIFCQAITRKSIREGKPRNCLAKGYKCANNRWLCRFHGSQNLLGFNKPNYTDDTRKKQLRKLKQFRSWTDQQFEDYFNREVSTRIKSGAKSRYYTQQSNKWKYFNSLYSIKNKQSIGDQLERILSDIRKKS